MSNAAVPVKHYAMYGGMDAGSEPHLLGENKWRFLQNMRLNSGLKQVQRVRRLHTLTTQVDALINMPNAITDHGQWLAIGRNGLYRVTASGVTSFAAAVDSPMPFSYCVYNGRIYYVNPANRVRSTDGGTLYEVYENRQSWTKLATEELLNAGSFTGHPLYEGVTPVGNLKDLFDWLDGTHYRVYVEQPHVFEVGSYISIRDRRGEEEDRLMFGYVAEVHEDYLVVRAHSAVIGVTNIGRTLSETVIADQPRLVRPSTMSIPSGRYVRVFFDHLVIGAPTYRGSDMPHKTMWSDLYNFSQWVPDSSNEADSYTHSEFQRGDDIVRGITGLAHFGEMLLIFTPSCIYAMEYTGLPRVMRVHPFIKDFGNGLPYASAELHSSVVWCDVHHGSFFAFRGEGPEDIGKPIADYFFNDVSNESSELMLTKALVSRKYHEVAWHYVSKVSPDGGYDKAVVYDYVNNAWAVRTLTDVSAIGMWNKRGLTVNEMTDLVDDVDTIVNESEDSGEQLADVVAGKYVGRHELSSDTEASLDAQSAPVLETGDLLYGSMQTIKEVSSIWIDASTAVRVEVSAREFIDDTVNYVHVGTWTKNLAERVLTFAPIVGRILRYRFTPITPVRNFVFRGFEDNVFSVDSSR